uniref:Secreted protein n=1 Tax=Bursaphelenchus xylophilus TaxID=6326 RepID=A0A1I7SUG7_BURXY
MVASGVALQPVPNFAPTICSITTCDEFGVGTGSIHHHVMARRNSSACTPDRSASPSNRGRCKPNPAREH